MVINMKINRFLDWFIHMLGYALVLIIVSLIFKKTVIIDTSYYGLWGLVAVIIIFVLNRTIKPILVWMTLPLTALTLGLFYPIINIFILKLTDIILGEHFDIHGTIFLFIVSVVISVMNAIMDNVMIDGFLKGKR